MFRALQLCFLIAASALSALAQSPSPTEKLQGYALRGDTTIFLFDASAYPNVNAPQRVAVTGGFRTWSTNMEDQAWWLAESDPGVWSLRVANSGFETVAPASPFKFRVDDAVGSGRWLDPAASATNVAGGNLIFLFGVDPPRLRAELRGPRAIWARVSGDDVFRPLSVDDYRLTMADGTDVPIAAVLPHESETALIVPEHDIDTRRVYYLTARTSAGALRSMASFSGVWRTMYSDLPLGANIVDLGYREMSRSLQTEIRLFAPRADSVRVFFYPDNTAAESESYALAPIGNGVWEVTRPSDLHGTWYDFAVYGPDDPGNTFTNHTGKRVRDPYARVAADWGRGRIWRATEPARPLANGRPALADLVSYEVHLQDFTDNLPVSDDLRGTIPAMVIPGLRNSRGEPIGIDHLEKLGINAVHLLPMQEYLHYPDDAWREAFSKDPLMQSQGVAEENYQWGYRITDFFAVENRYRQRGTEHGAEREQFRDLVQAFHDRGIAVLVDYVFNHTGENMEGLDHILSFNGIDRHYAYRLDQEGANIGPYGNEVKSEERPMMQRWLLDQMRAYIDEFGVDGFRIDLAGATDEQTLRMIRAALPDDIIIYGEPWIPPSDPDVIGNPDWFWYKEDAPIVYFQDTSRNAFKGPVSTPRDPAVDRGFAGGDGTQRETVMQALTATLPDEHSPLSGISYLDIHDNWALADQFATFTEGPNAWDGRAGVDEAAVRIAATLLFTTPGPLVLHGGTEFLRSKGAAPHPDELGGERIVETSIGPIYLKGRGDTYNLREPNRFVWENVGRSDGPVDYAGMMDWWRGLIALRASELGKTFRRSEPLAKGDITFVLPQAEHAEGLAYIVKGVGAPDLLIVVNPGATPARFRVPGGAWSVLAQSDRESGRLDLAETLGPLDTGRRVGDLFDVSVPPQGVIIARRAR